MKKHTTFKIGGPADIFVDAESPSEVLTAVKIAKETGLPRMIIGNGSNLLVSDKGIEGVVICIGSRMNKITVKENIIEAYAGALLSSVSNTAQRNSLTGLEFAAGIPGTLGGGVYMNAGAYDGELKNVVKSVTYIDGVILKRTNTLVKEINAGCICCQVTGDFKESILDVVENCNVDRLLVEPTGVAKLSDIKKVFNEKELKGIAEVEKAITVVDAEKFDLYLTNFKSFFINQIKNADIIILERKMLVMKR